MKTPFQIILLIVAFVAAFLIGFIPAHLKFNSSEEAAQKIEQACTDQINSKDVEIASIKHKIQFTKIRDILSLTLIEIEKKNYGVALDKFKLFTEEWEQFKNNEIAKDKITDADIKRDEIVTELAQSKPQIKDKIIELLEKFHAITF
ncbi:MAG: hypothetical protein A2Y62_05105 [Candidatus Fischerbacteria bacterium RBG_13_37_8]|uniref:Uncharacterized protein n=1 Tax=Candidatus Fischerbacteria bacterium RBG_13_37_8 TaxID=1817863 RepID=A0A1F5V8G1_9BACT|nr:MAG: hypothetical protein A2Y62_05105 [Candidatus Fischerbacteria bacterium RBG_13_37_8]